MKLNLGCGVNKLPGYVNVDKYGEPDVRHDLESFPWPWPDDTFEEVRAVHVLEHLGSDADTFIGVVKEIYRVARNGARFVVIVPHHRHDDFVSDPTHVRPVTPLLMSLFSRRLNLEWQAQGFSNSPFALFHNVDFETRAVDFQLDEPYLSDYKSGRLDKAQLERLVRESNNIVKQVKIELEVVKAPS